MSSPLLWFGSFAKFLKTPLIQVLGGDPSTPSSGYSALYFKSGGLYSKDSAGSVVQYGTASTATPTAQGIVTSYFPIIQSAVSTVTNSDVTCTTTDGYETFLFSTGSTNRTLNLPAAATNNGRIIKVFKTDSGTGQVIVDPNSSELINGVSTAKLFFINESMTIVCNGTGWYILDYVWNDSPQSFTISVTNFGSFNTRTSYFRRDGQYMEIWGAFQSGTPAASLGYISIPNSLNINSSGLYATTTASSSSLVGTYVPGATSGDGGNLVACTSTSTQRLYFATRWTGVAGCNIPANASSMIGLNDVCTFQAKIPISEWA